MSKNPELIVNNVVDQDGMKMWIVSTNDDCLKNYETVFGLDALKILGEVIRNMKQDFYVIYRYYQFVGIFNYHHLYGMYSMKLFEPTSTNSHLDAFTKLLSENWKKEDLEKISKISEEIINDFDKINASIILNDQ